MKPRDTLAVPATHRTQRLERPYASFVPVLPDLKSILLGSKVRPGISRECFGIGVCGGDLDAGRDDVGTEQRSRFGRWLHVGIRDHLFLSK